MTLCQTWWWAAFWANKKVPLISVSVPLSLTSILWSCCSISHLDRWYMAKGPVYSCAWWPTKLFTNIFDTSSIRLSWQPFLLQILSLHSILFDSEQHKRALKPRLTNPFCQIKELPGGTSSTLLHGWMRWKEANLVDDHSEAARLLCCVPSP